jgi:hypothetical protein|tara:strand:+ start:600 stop:779 length:180 start_codon:yes stop_codon:yes gene_type:complete
MTTKQQKTNERVTAWRLRKKQAGFVKREVWVHETDLEELDQWLSDHRNTEEKHDVREKD